MRLLLRRVRGIAGMALLWAAAWAPAYAVYAVWRFRHVVRVVRDGVELPLHWWLIAARGAMFGASAGAAMGAIFALLLVALARRRQGTPLSIRLTATCGALAVGAIAGAAELPLAHLLTWLRPVVLLVPGGALTAAPIGAALAAGALLLARRDPGRRLAAGAAPLPHDRLPSTW